MTVTLKEYVESRLDAIEKAVTIANTVLQAQLEEMQNARYVTQDEMKEEIKILSGSIDELKEFKALLDGKATQTQADISLIIGIIGLIIGLISLAIKLF